MVRRLAAGVEEDIVRELVAATKAIVEINGGARNVEHDILAQRRLRADRLKVKGRLLLVVSNLPGEIALDARATRLHAAEARVGLAIKEPPRGDRTLP